MKRSSALNDVIVPLGASPSPSLTLAELIRVGLADEITSGRLAPGFVLDEQEIAGRFGASRTPVREALRELAASGLVTILPRRGVRVAAPTTERLDDLFELMAETEALCVRLATYRMTSVERFALQTLHKNSHHAVERNDVDGYDRQNRDFHSAIYQACHNAALADHAAGLRLRIAPFRRAQFNISQRVRESFAEHEQIIAQVLQGDGEAAGRLMRAHMLTASATLTDYLNEAAGNPRPHADPDRRSRGGTMV